MLLAAVVLALAPRCGGSLKPEKHAYSSGHQEQERAELSAPTAQGAIVLALILDQLPSDAIDRLQPVLDAEGYIGGQLAGQGLRFQRVRFPYANTYTAAGHATIYTGYAPTHHGVSANAVWDRLSQSVVPAYTDSQHAVLGTSGATAGPGRLRLPTVADWLHHARKAGQSRVVSVSLKDRAAIPGGGRQARDVYWYEAGLCGFTTSTYYHRRKPTWLAAWQGEDYVRAYLKTPWTPLKPDAYAALGLIDDRPGEGDYQGLGTTFPRTLDNLSEPCKAIRATPAAGPLLLDFALHLAKARKLGQGDTRDFLAVSISHTDYIGHIFGWDSVEYTDNLVRTDRDVARFIAALRKLAPVDVVLTSDHGALALPEALGEPFGRIGPQALAAELNAALEAKGLPAAVAQFVPPYVYLDEGAYEAAAHAQIIATLLETLQQRVGIEAAVHVGNGAVHAPVTKSEEPHAATPASAADRSPSLQEAIAAGIEVAPQGDIFVVPARNYVVDAEPPTHTGTSHGSPFAYDTDVPVFIDSPRVKPGACSGVHSMLRVAPTLLWLLDTPHMLPGEPLLGCSVTQAPSP